MKDLISIIYRGIQSEYEAIQIYKEVANEARQLEKEDVALVFDEIARDEMQHIGNLEELLKKFLPEDYKEFNTKADEGHKETEDDLKKYEKGITTSGAFSDYIKCLEKYVKAQDIQVSSDNANFTVITISKSLLDNPQKVLQELQLVRNSSDGISYGKDTITVCVHG